jgi:NADPH:quinone reductase-like Zn-dependent oxidoreductase
MFFDKQTFVAVATLLVVSVLPGLGATADAETFRQYQLQKQGKAYELVMKDVAVARINAEQILVKVHAASLNRRDIYVIQGFYRGPEANGKVPLSDGAGEVVAVGSNVTRFKVGDRVVGTFFTNWNGGKFSAAALASARGGAVDGMLSEMVVATEDSLVKIPSHLSFAEAATLPCAGVTAWNGLFKAGNLQAGEYVLLEGTGGVSTFGLLFSAAVGAKPIITSSKDEKLEKARGMGAIGTANYRKNPNWSDAVLEITGGRGVDHVLEVGGEKTLPQAMKSLAAGGHIAVIGGLSGFGASVRTSDLLFRSASVSGIYVGSRADFEAMIALIEKHQIRPLIGKEFSFDDAPAAYEFMQNGNYMGKIVIRMDR